MSPLRTLGALSFAAAGLLLACDRTDGTGTPQGAPAARSDKSGVTNMQPVVDTAAVERLASARCNREQSCNKVGAGQTYATRAVCIDQMRGNIANDLNSYKCPRGIDAEHVNHCLLAVENEQCDHPLDTLQRIEKCSTSELCTK